MAERSGRPPLFRLRFPFWTSPVPATPAPPRPPPPPRPVTPSQNAVAALQPATQDQQTPASAQPPPPPATPPRNVAQQAASQSQPPPSPVVPQFKFPSSLTSAHPEMVPGNEPSSTSYKDATNQANENESIQTQSMTETSTMTSINLNTNEEAPRNSSPAKKARETDAPHSSSVMVPEPVMKQENEVEKREVTKEVVDHNGKHTTSREKKEQGVENKAYIEAVDMVPTPTKNRTFQQQEAAADQMTETDIQEKQEVPSVHKSTPTGLMEERSSIISTDQYSKPNHTRRRESSFGEKNGLQRTIDLDTSNVSPQCLQHSSSETGIRQPLNLITLAGQNNGATMNITSEEETKDGTVAIHRGHQLHEDHKGGMEANNEESKNQSNKRKSEAMEMITGTFANSNSQSINNSIFHNSSCSERSPGVHIEFFKGLPAEVDNLKKQEQTGDLKIQQPTSETRIRRRCLRSLFMDSDSDIESPHKPRRHGCRFNCKAFGLARDKNADNPTEVQDDVQSNVEK